MAPPSLRLIVDAVIAQLRSTEVLVGDAEPPPGFGWTGTPGQAPFTPHMIVYPLTGRFDGMLAGPRDHASLIVQVTCVGQTREQCQWVLDAAVGALVGQTLTVPTIQIELDDLQRVVRDDTVQPPVFMAPPRFRIWTA